MTNNRFLPKVSIRIVQKVLLSVIVLSAIFVSGYYFGLGENTKTLYPKVIINRELPEDKGELNFSLFWKVWDTLHQKYFDQSKIIPSELVYGAIQGMVAAVGDPYTAFIPPAQYKVVKEDLNGSFEGVGIQIGFKGTTLAVISPLPDSPAENAGIEAGDLIVGIKDETKGVDRGTGGISLPEAVQIIRGPAGSTVTLLIVREGEEEVLEIDVVRDRIDVDSVTLELAGDDNSVAHIKILKFSGETLSQWNNTVIEVLKNPSIKGIVLDVRNNPGGFLDAAVDIASEFLSDAEVVVQEEYMDGNVNEFSSEGIGRLRGRKVVILVNEGSASASEILAGALRDLLGTQIVGEVTFGKGTIQEPQTIEDGSGLHITIAKWLTPNGNWVNEVGLVPDLAIEDDPETEKDEQLESAIGLLEN